MNIPTQSTKIWASALLLGAIAFSSCEKESDDVCGGTPSISGVTMPTKRDAAATTGNLTDWVIIQGSNFCNVKQVLFNDIEADLTDAYITQNEITLRVPRAVPKEVTNKISVVTDGGSADSPYTVVVPSLSLSSLTNEYAVEGEQAVLVGKFFDLYGVTPQTGKVMLGETAVAITRSTADSVFFVVPAGVAANSEVKVVDANGVTTTMPGGRFRDGRNIIFSYDTNGSVWGGTDFITNAASPGAISGSYVRVNKVVDAWAWTELSANNNIVIPADALVNPGNYALKFEINTLKIFNNNKLLIAIDGDPGGNPPLNTYVWDATAASFTTKGKWVTRSIDLNQFITKPIPEKAMHEVRVVLFGGAILDADISFDNFRIVPKN
ncbi:glycan-binding surface protein [uncultured Hymenobacter sp.]|uniref:glycan-binding surface protein n=1 Tax=uncultured Hymenobacter sp. TaxID=170016 RepID=UPI0035CA12AA